MKTFPAYLVVAALVAGGCGSSSIKRDSDDAADAARQSAPTRDLAGVSVLQLGGGGEVRVDLSKFGDDASIAMFTRGACAAFLQPSEIGDRSVSLAGGAQVSTDRGQVVLRGDVGAAFLIGATNQMAHCEWTSSGIGCAPCRPRGGVQQLFTVLQVPGLNAVGGNTLNAQFLTGIDDNGCSGGTVPTAVGPCSSSGYLCGEAILMGLSSRAQCLAQCDASNDPRCEPTGARAVACSLAGSCR